uniref:Uncharacterized protein n=1 Tax=Tetranychus urticae TaxID=32264 RepID=T1JZN7_TETUR
MLPFYLDSFEQEIILEPGMGFKKTIS